MTFVGLTTTTAVHSLFEDTFCMLMVIRACIK